MKNKIIYIFHIFIIVLPITLYGCSNTPDIWDESDPEWIEGVPAHTDGGYLFAFITSSEYYRLHYAVSRDAYNCQTLNNGKIINETYIGHPDMSRTRRSV